MFQSADPDAITDLVEAVIDELDELGGEASASVVGSGELFTLILETTSLAADRLDATFEGFSRIRTALHAAGVGTAKMPYEAVSVEPSIRPLETAASG